jgi:hypothetical protein
MIHPPSCEQRGGSSPCVCPIPKRGDVVMIEHEGLRGRWRVMKVEADRVAIARAGRVEWLYGREEISWTRATA